METVRLRHRPRRVARQGALPPPPFQFDLPTSGARMAVGGDGATRDLRPHALGAAVIAWSITTLGALLDLVYGLLGLTLVSALHLALWLVEAQGASATICTVAPCSESLLSALSPLLVGAAVVTYVVAAVMRRRRARNTAAVLLLLATCDLAAVLVGVLS